MTLTSERLNELAKQIHADNVAVGWWDNIDQDGLVMKANLIVTELAEALEGLRKDKMDEHLPQRKSEEVELADAMIRLLDLMGYKNIKIEAAFDGFLCDSYDADAEPAYNYVWLFTYAADIAKDIIFSESMNLGCDLLIYEIIERARIAGYDLEAAMLEKMEYNRKRADHKRENRAKEGGKKF